MSEKRPVFSCEIAATIYKSQNRLILEYLSNIFEKIQLEMSEYWEIQKLVLR